MKKVLKIISTGIVWLVTIVSVCVMIFTVVSVNTFNRNDRSILGHKAYIVLSDSMSATDFDAGDLILVKEVDPTTLVPGDIIAYTSQSEESYGQTVTHKIRRLTTDEQGNAGFITYGTTTDVDDEIVVTYPFVQGKYAFHLPKVGTFFQFLKTTQGYIVCILVPFLIMILYQGLNCVRIFRLYKAEQMAELQAEKDALEEQRRQSEAMMAQLLAMQQQMQAMGQAPPQTQPPMQFRIPVQPVEPQIPVQPQAPTQPVQPQTPVQPQAPVQPEMDAMMAEFAALQARMSGKDKVNNTQGGVEK